MGGRNHPQHRDSHTKATLSHTAINSRRKKKKRQGFPFVKGQGFSRTNQQTARPCNVQDIACAPPKSFRVQTPGAPGAAACSGSCSFSVSPPAYTHWCSSIMSFTGETRSKGFQSLFTICRHFPQAGRDEVVGNIMKQVPHHLFETQIARDHIKSSNINLYLPTNQH